MKNVFCNLGYVFLHVFKSKHQAKNVLTSYYSCAQVFCRLLYLIISFFCRPAQNLTVIQRKKVTKRETPTCLAMICAPCEASSGSCLFVAGRSATHTPSENTLREQEASAVASSPEMFSHNFFNSSIDKHESMFVPASAQHEMWKKFQYD